MGKIFEELFVELQADMIDICLEYVEERADIIYIYCSFEQNALTNNFFYRINDMLVKKHKLNDAAKNGKNYDVSIDRQQLVVKEINKDIEKINALCREHNKPMPTEMKIIYDVRRKNMETEYLYDCVYSNAEDKSAMMICDEWFNSLI
ncbi:hypothetical protein FACS1894137_08380 [Spirochaetia bacterium]|nr:hypothetical protein FACS1894137_08380 [Spirochaetia bacterium]